MLRLSHKNHSIKQDDNTGMTKGNEVSQLTLSKEIDTMITVARARANLLRRISEMKEELGIEDDSQILIIEE